MSNPTPVPRPVQIKPLDHYRLWVQYSDGLEGIVDLASYAGDGVFAAWDDYREFQKVHVGPNGEIAWSEQIDMCPDAIYLAITGKKPEDLFPSCREIAVDAGN
jgi:hypothetical protein